LNPGTTTEPGVEKSQLEVKDHIPLQLCKTRELEGKRARRCNHKQSRSLKKLQEHVYIHICLTLSQQMSKQRMHPIHTTWYRSDCKQKWQQSLKSSRDWSSTDFGFFFFFLLTIHSVALMTMTHHWLIISPLLHRVVPHALLGWNNSTAASHPEKQQQQGTVQQVYSPCILW